MARGSRPPASLLQLGEGIEGPGSGWGGGQEPTLGLAAPLPSSAFHQDTVRGLRWPRAKASGRNLRCLCVGQTGLHRSRQSPEFTPAPATSRAQVHTQSHSRPSDSWGRAGGAHILAGRRRGSRRTASITARRPRSTRPEPSPPSRKRRARAGSSLLNVPAELCPGLSPEVKHVWEPGGRAPAQPGAEPLSVSLLAEGRGGKTTHLPNVPLPHPGGPLGLGLKDCEAGVSGWVEGEGQ